MAESGDSGKQSGTTRVRVGYPYGALHNHAVSGVPDPITDEFTDEPVADAKLKQLRKVAKANGVPLEETTKEPEEANS